MTISQNLAYAVLTVNEYKYTYIYGKSDAESFKTFMAKKGEGATVRWQSKTDITAYTQPIYPSDLPTATNFVKTSLQVVYSIDITNNTNTDIEGFYKEKKMMISNLRNVYDANRYTPTKKARNTDTFKSWEETGASNEVKYIGHEYDNGIAPGQTITTYITFDVKEEALASLLEHPEGIVEYVPTTAFVTATHEYTRYDYSWKKSTDKNDNSRETWRYYAIDNYNNYNQNGGKTHYTIPETKSDRAPYLAIQLYSNTGKFINRTISGSVFKDNNILTNHEVIGDGIYGTTETTIQNVKAELIDMSTGSNAELYKIEKDDDIYKSVKEEALTITNSEGRYTFEGVVPGQYIVRFTYGNGEQKYLDMNGNEIQVYSNGYKSTIVTKYGDEREEIKKAFNETNEKSKAARWYLKLRTNEFNTAVDDGINDNSFKYIQKIDYRTQNNDNTIKEPKTASTPLISVPIEFFVENEGRIKDHAPSFERMSFGIIEKPKIIMNIKKEISNVKLTLQNGQVLLNGNPAIQSIPYVANLDSIWSKTGSSNIKIELDNQ